MKKFTLYLVLLLIVTGPLAKAQYLALYNTTPTEICYGQSVFAYVDDWNLPPGNWRFEWHRIEANCAGFSPFYLAGVDPFLTITSSGEYVCVAYEDNQGLTYQTMSTVLVRVLPNPSFPGGPTHLRKPQHYGPADCVPSLQLCIPDAHSGNLPVVKWYKDNVVIPNETGLYYTATATGYYKYQIISQMQCGSPFSDSVYVSISTPLPTGIYANGPTTFCTGGSVTLTAPAGAGLFYQWKNNGIDILGATSINYVATTSGNYTCAISNATCSSAISNSIGVTVRFNPSVSYSGLATSYNLTSPPATLTGNPTGGTFSGPGISGNIFTPSVAGPGIHTITYSYTNTYGCTGTYSRNTSICSPPSAPATVTGNTNPCANSTGIVYSCSAVSGASSYSWTVPATATLVSGQGTNSIVVNFGSSFTTGTISAAATSSCGTGSAQSLQVYGAPVQPAPIVGQKTAVCAGTQGLVYSIPAVPGATSYIWTAPPKSTIMSGQGTNQIVVNFGAQFKSGNMTVAGVNSCGTGLTRSATIRSVPSVPGAISGPTTFCSNQQGVVYSIAAVGDASTYQWLVPTGSTIVSGQGTTSITVNYGNKAGKIQVRAGNTCGYSTYRQLTVSKTCREGIFEDGAEENQIAVFPNPSSADFTVLTGNSDEQTAIIEVFEMTGKMIYRTEERGASIIIPGSALPPGVYNTVITNSSLRQNLRIVKIQ